MSLKTLITKSAEYNDWVVNKYINWLADKSDDQLNQEVPSIFPTILKTLNHILQTQEY
ncbi:MAG: DinB family protein, partial [Sphingobacterium siyangense]